MKLRRINIDVFVERRWVWSIAWVVVAIPVTLLLTLPPTAPDAAYQRAIARAEQLGRLMTVSGPVPPSAASSYAVPDVATTLTPDVAAKGSVSRYVVYLQHEALAREHDANTLHGARIGATLIVVMLSACVLPLWLALVSVTRQSLRRRS